MTDHVQLPPYVRSEIDTLKDQVRKLTIADMNMNQRRITNLGPAIGQYDAVTLKQLTDAREVVQPSTLVPASYGDIIPHVDSIYDLGSPTRYWALAYIDKVNIDARYYLSISGTTTYLFFDTAGSNDYMSFSRSTNVLSFTIAGTAALKIADTATTSYNDIVPSADDLYKCGIDGKRWDEVWAANGTIQTSGRKKKENIADSVLGLDFVQRLQPRSYNWKDGLDTERKHQGLVAEELEVALEGEEFGGLYNEGETPGLCYAEFTPVLIKAINDIVSRLKDKGIDIKET